MVERRAARRAEEREREANDVESPASPGISDAGEIKVEVK